MCQAFFFSIKIRISEGLKNATELELSSFLHRLKGKKPTISLHSETSLLETTRVNLFCLFAIVWGFHLIILERIYLDILTYQEMQINFSLSNESKSFSTILYTLIIKIPYELDLVSQNRIDLSQVLHHEFCMWSIYIAQLISI